MTALEYAVPLRAGHKRFVNMLESLEVQAFLGIHPVERSERQRVIINVQLLCDYADGPMADDIASVVDYDFLRDGIAAMVDGERFALQEVLCERIAALCWDFAPVTAVEVATRKPDIYADASIGCRIVRLRPGAS